MAWEIGFQSLVELYQRFKKMVLYSYLLYIQHYKVCDESKVEHAREKSSALPYASV